jgi:hypothetical protein
VKPLFVKSRSKFCGTAFYGFTTTPFTKSIDSQNLYPSRGHRETQGRLAFALQERLPALITGDSLP